MPKTSNHGERPYLKVGPVYAIKADDKRQYFLSVRQWKDSVNASWHYFLQLNNLVDNTIFKQKEIVIAKKEIQPDQIIGKVGNNIWILLDSLVAYDELTLELSVTESGLSKINPFMEGKFNRAYSTYLADEAAQVIYFRDVNGERLKLYPGLKIKPDDSNNESAPEDFNYEIAANYKLYDRCELKYSLMCVDTSINTLYIIGSKKETGYVLSYFGTSIFPDQNEDRQLTVVPFTRGEEKNNYDKHPPVTGNDHYYKGGFLLNKFTNTIWKGGNQERIILFHSNKSGNGNLAAALVNKEGKQLWKADSGFPVNQFNDYLVFDNNLVLWFTGLNKATGLKQTMVINFNLETGNQSNYGF